MMTYYIVKEKRRDGPYDTLGILRKIRSNILQPTQLIAIEEEGEARELQHLPEFKEVLEEQDQARAEEEENRIKDNTISFPAFFKSGLSAVMEDSTPAILTSVMVLIIGVIMAGTIIAAPPATAAFVVPYVGYLSFIIYFIIMLPLSRVQLLSFSNISKSIKHRELSLIASPVIPATIAFSLPWLLSVEFGVITWLLFIFPGLPVLAYFMYVPLLITDRELDLVEALKQNRVIFKKFGSELMIAMVALLSINIIALVTVIGPLLTLPVTLLALMSIYDKHFYDS